MLSNRSWLTSRTSSYLQYMMDGVKIYKTQYEKYSHNVISVAWKRLLKTAPIRPYQKGCILFSCKLNLWKDGPYVGYASPALLDPVSCKLPRCLLIFCVILVNLSKICGLVFYKPTLGLHLSTGLTNFHVILINEICFLERRKRYGTIYFIPMKRLKCTTCQCTVALYKLCRPRFVFKF